jgi:hypothetical protein
LALKSGKSGKTGGFDVVHPKFIENSGQRTKEWIVAFFNDILTSGKISKEFKHAKVIRILKSEKMVLILRTFNQFHCSVSYSKAVVPVAQAGFRKNHSCILNKFWR